MSNLTEKRTEIVKGLEKVFPDREVTMKQLMEWAEKEGLSKYAPSFIWKSENKVRRGVFRIPEIGANVADAKVAFVPMATKEEKEVSLATNVIEFPKNETESYVPAKVGNYVKFGHYGDVKTIKKSGQFYPVFITGLSGNGKTMMIEQVHADLKKELFRVNITIETDEDDLIGHYALIDGKTVWQDGPVVLAMERGATLLLDEVDLASNKIMCLQPVLEGNPLLIKKEGRIVRPKTGFTVMATANTKGKGSEDGRFIGTNILNEAFLERFPITVEQEYPSVTVEKKIINKLMTSLNCLDEEFSAKLVDWADLIRKTFYDGGVDEIIATRRLVHIVHAFSIFKDRMKAIAMCVARFDDQTKETFMDLYSKLDEKVSMPSDETEEGEDSESTETEEKDENFSPF
ncbi:MAG: AAA family ATPase [Candidatus Pacebacteria bacterium]|nr:AAA family ATPase [Candidatus Paceibacterota bacterium]